MKYYFNNTTDTNGNHEVHVETCSWLPSSLNRTYIGNFSNCSDAIRQAKNDYPYRTFDGCYWCCRANHNG